MTSTVNREVESGIHIVSLKSSAIEETFITADLQGGDIAPVAAEAMDAVKARGAAVVAQTVFAPLGAKNESVAAMTEALGDCDWPVTWVDSGHRKGSNLGGMHIYAVSGVDVERVEMAGRTVASVFQDDSARFCCLGDIRADDVSADRDQQARRTFDMIESVLESAGMDFSNIIRTWLYLDRLLQWYDPFNRVRDDFFRQRGVFDELVPASTGISGANPAGAAVVAMATGVQPLNGSVRAAMLPSPLQCPALDYGSSFSRAVELTQPGSNRITVSGTASIEPGGKTVFLDNAPKQIELTMRVVEAILAQRDMTWADVMRGIAYFKDERYYRDYEDYCRDNGLPDMPVIVTENDVCRDDLLFEIELDAVTAN